MEEDVFKKLEYYFNSNQFNIATQTILNLQMQVGKWMKYGNTGAIIYGRPRVGKTRAILYITRELQEKYGPELPVYVYNVTSHAVSDKKFYQELLLAVGHPEFEKGTTTVLKNRLLNSLVASASVTKSKKVVLFIDEAQNMSVNDFEWLMDIYNNLSLWDIHMVSFLFGSLELKSLKSALIMAQKKQIIGRFMVDEFNFKGIMGARYIAVTLLNFDTPISNNGELLTLTQVYFPEAFADGHRISACASEIMEAFAEVMKEHNIHIDDIPMQYYMGALKYCLCEYGKSGKSIYFPDKSAWRDAVHNSGFIQSEMLNYDAAYT